MGGGGGRGGGSGAGMRGKKVPPTPMARPEGVPKDWPAKPSQRKEGTRYTNPKNPHEIVRVMPGNPQSRWPAQRAPYVKHHKDGKAYDSKGNLVDQDAVEAHIPLKDYKFPR
jgi:hypothetical protein